MNILYSACGAKYLKEAMLSAKSVLKQNPDAQIVIYTDQIRSQGSGGIRFEKLPENQRPTISKQYAINHFDSDRVIYLDTDTQIRGSLSQLWNLLDVYDFVIANEPANIPRCPDVPPFTKYKNSRHYNAGVFGYRKTDAISSFFSRWKSILDGASDEDIQIGARRNDQEVLNELIFEQKFFSKEGIKCMVVDNVIFNARGVMFKELEKDGILSNAVILHCHSIWAPLYTKGWWKLISLWRQIKRLTGMGK